MGKKRNKNGLKSYDSLMAWVAKDNTKKARQRAVQYRREREQTERKLGQFAKENAFKFGTGEIGANHLHTAPVHGTTEEGLPVTAAFGLEGTKREGQTYLADGHAEDFDGFWGPNHAKKHDDFWGDGGGTQRGQYTGYGS